MCSVDAPPDNAHHNSGMGRVSQTYGQLPLTFEANRGQSDAQVKFLSRGSGYTLFLTPSEAVLTLRKPALLADKQGMMYSSSLLDADATEPDALPTANPWQATPGGGFSDAFVAKLNPTGSSLAYSTYLGGSNSDFGRGIAVDALGNAYVTGYTGSPDFLTASPLQATRRGSTDAFIAKLIAGGSAFVYSTYLGGSSSDAGQSIAVDTSGSAYVTGHTRSLDFLTASPLQAANGGNSDVFVAKIAAVAPEVGDVDQDVP